jgi:hypothetical protein
MQVIFSISEIVVVVVPAVAAEGLKTQINQVSEMLLFFRVQC